MFNITDNKQITPSVKKISSNKTLLTKISTFLIMSFVLFGATPSYATNPNFITTGIVNSSEQDNASDNNQNIPTEQELTENTSPEALAKIRNHDWYKKDNATDNGIQKQQKYTYFYHKTAQEIYDLKPGGI